MRLQPKIKKRNFHLLGILFLLLGFYCNVSAQVGEEPSRFVVEKDWAGWKRAIHYPDTIKKIYVGYEEYTAGNVRRLLPAASVRSYNLPFYNPIKEQKLCYFVWSEELIGISIPDHLTHITEQEETIHVKGEWRHLFRERGWRITEWGISPIGENSSLYKNWCTN